MEIALLTDVGRNGQIIRTMSITLLTEQDALWIILADGMEDSAGNIASEMAVTDLGGLGRYPNRLSQ